MRAPYRLTAITEARFTIASTDEEESHARAHRRRLPVRGRLRARRAHPPLLRLPRARPAAQDRRGVGPPAVPDHGPEDVRGARRAAAGGARRRLRADDA